VTADNYVFEWACSYLYDISAQSRKLQDKFKLQALALFSRWNSTDNTQVCVKVALKGRFSTGGDFRARVAAELSLRKNLRLSVGRSVGLSILFVSSDLTSLSDCLSVYLSVCLSVCLSILLVFEYIVNKRPWQSCPSKLLFALTVYKSQ